MNDMQVTMYEKLLKTKDQRRQRTNEYIQVIRDLNDDRRSTIIKIASTVGISCGGRQTIIYDNIRKNRNKIDSTPQTPALLRDMIE